MQTRFVLAGIALASMLGLAAADIKKVALQGEMTPEASYFYRKFGFPVVSDAPGHHVAVYNRSPGGKRCIFKLDPDSDPDLTVACEKEPSPDGNRPFQRFGPPTINTAADVAWASKVAFGRNGAFRGDPTLVARIGDPVPAPGTGLLKTLSLARITTTGDVAFLSDISGGAVVLGVEKDQGIFRCTGGDGNCSSGTGTLQTLLLVGDPVPDRVGRQFCRFRDLVASSYGVSFKAETQLDCSSNAEDPLNGIFRMAFAGSAETLALGGEMSEPFPAPGGTFYIVFPSAPAIEDTGAVAFVASTGGVSATSGLYRCDPGTCPPAPADALIIRGDLDDDGNAFRSFGPPGISALRDVAFMARLNRTTGGTIQGLYVRRTSGDIETIALTEDPVPNLSPPATFRFSMSPPGVSAGGKIAFKARIKRLAAKPRNLEGIFVVESPSGAFLDRDGGF